MRESEVMSLDSRANCTSLTANWESWWIIESQLSDCQKLIIIMIIIMMTMIEA